jgi:hypothetical protein
MVNSGSFAHSATTLYLNWPDPTIIEHSLRVHPFEIRASRRRWQTASSYVLRPTLLGQWLLPMLSGRIETNGGVTMPYGGNDWLALTQEPTLESEIPICELPIITSGISDPSVSPTSATFFTSIG